MASKQYGNKIEEQVAQFQTYATPQEQSAIIKATEGEQKSSGEEIDSKDPQYTPLVSNTPLEQIQLRFTNKRKPKEPCSFRVERSKLIHWRAYCKAMDISFAELMTGLMDDFIMSNPLKPSQMDLYEAGIQEQEAAYEEKQRLIEKGWRQ